MRVLRKNRWRFQYTGSGVHLWFGVLVFLCLTFLGLVNLTHADWYSGKDFHRAQLVWTLLGFGVAVLLMMVDLTVVRRLAPLLYWLCVALLVVVLFTKAINQSRRWFAVFGFHVQPSELMKPAVALMLAHHYRGQKMREYRNLIGLLKPITIVLLPAALVLVEPDLGTAIVLVGIGSAVIFFEGVRLRTFLVLLGLVALLFPLAWRFDLIRPYQKERILLWINPEGFEWTAQNRALLEKTIQPERARWAIGSGKLLGKGAREGSRMRLRRVAEMHTDYIVVTLAEEYGFAGCMAILLMFYLYVLWGLGVAGRAVDRFGALLAVGVVSTLALQVFVNLGMVTGLFPVVGVTLPLFSYGGSSLLATLAGFGLLLAVARSRGTL